MKQTTIKLKYTFLQCLYWILYAVGFGYVTLFLTKWDYTASGVGIIVAIACTASTVIQPVVGKIADKLTAENKMGWKIFTLVYLSIMAVDFLIMLIFHIKLIQGICYGLFIMLLQSMMPLVNAASFYYCNRGINIQFGIARGFGSLSYSITCFFLGKTTASGNVIFIIYAGLVFSILMLVLTFIFQRVDTSVSLEKLDSSNPNSSSTLDFIKNNKTFCLVLLGFVLSIMAHNIAGTYLLQISLNLGGTSTDMGNLNSIMAILELPVMFGFAFLHKKISATNLLKISAVSFLLKTLGYFLAAKVWHLYLIQIFQMLGFAIFAPASVFYADESVAEGDKVKAQSMVGVTITLGQVFGNLFGGIWCDVYGSKNMMLIASVVAAVGAIFVLFFTRKKCQALQ